MVNKCYVFGCRSNYKGEEIVPVFSFRSNEDIKDRWIKFVNRKDWQPTSSAVICIKHFEGKFLKKGEHEKRFRLIKTLKPIPTIYPASTKTSFTYKVSLPRKSPKKRVFSMVNLKGTTILLVWKVFLNQTVHKVIFTPDMKIMLFFIKSF